MRNTSTEAVYKLIKQDSRVIAITADNPNEIYEKIHEEYPRQYIDYGIAEENMVGGAAGLASCGKIPFLYTITNFMSMRAYEFMRNLVCVPNLNVKFLGRSCGLTTGTWGMTHQGTEDLSLLRTLPNLIVISPATPIEAREAVAWAYRYQGPVYIRLEGYNEPELFDETYRFELNKSHEVRSGRDFTVIAMGSVINEAIAAADELKKEGISLRIIDFPTVQPGDIEAVKKVASETRGIITLEEHTLAGGLGSAIAEILVEQQIAIPFKRLGFEGCAKGCGNRKEMRELNHVAIADVINNIRKRLLK